LLYLPLDKLLSTSRAGADSAAPPAAKGDTSQGNDNDAAQRARDSLLSRDREAR
jgi:hypothetical protein